MTLSEAVAYIRAGSSKATPEMIANALGIPANMISSGVFDDIEVEEVRKRVRDSNHDNISQDVVSYLDFKLNQWKGSVTAPLEMRLQVLERKLQNIMDPETSGEDFTHADGVSNLAVAHLAEKYEGQRVLLQNLLVRLSKLEATSIP